MNLSGKILAIYPQLTELAFFDGSISLRNDSDGRGDYIERWDHPTLAQPTQAEIDAVTELSPQLLTIFSSLDYLQKFTTDEYAAARNHANVSVQFGLDMLIAAQYVDLDDPRVAMALDLLVAEGVVAPERRTELLAPQAA